MYRGVARANFRGGMGAKTSIDSDIPQTLTWNSLPQAVVDAVSVNSFKNRLDEFDKYFVEGC